MKKAVAFFLFMSVITLILSACNPSIPSKVSSSAGSTTLSESLVEALSGDDASIETSSETSQDESSVSVISLINGKECLLTFSDDFNGDKLDTSKWSLCPEWERFEGNYWSNKHVKTDGNGQLMLYAGEEGDVYSSGAIRTHGKFNQTYGYFEIRCKLQTEPGFWGAFWLMGYNVGKVGNGGKDGAEIDIFESAYLNSSSVNHAIHWDGYGSEHKSTSQKTTIPDLYTGFHTFALEWNKDEYIFYVDNIMTWRTNAGGICEVPLYLKITTEVGSWAGDISKANLPAAMVIDYVRVYKQVN